MPDGRTPSPFRMTPEFMTALAEGIASALDKTTVPGRNETPDTIPSAGTSGPPNPLQAGESLGAALAPLAAPLLAKVESRLKSRKLWVAVGTLVPLLAQNPLGLALPQAAQIAIAALAAIYVAAQALVDSAAKGGGNA